jgi:adenine-specific DNA methylase
LGDKSPRNLGSIYTPPDFAQFLTAWAVQTSQQRILDVGVGEGVFTFAAYQRLRELGAKPRNAQRQIYGAEINRSAYVNFLKAANEKDAEFPNVHLGDFFKIDFPQIGAVIGNPPYVRRAYLKERDVQKIRKSVVASNQSVDEKELSGLTDLYVYFLLRAVSLLEPGGKLAVITADSWLNTTYGETLKRYFQEQFVIERLISLDRRIFNASVKPALLLATKRPNKNATKAVEFIRLKNGLPINDLQLLLANPRLKKPDDVLVTKIKRHQLNPGDQWGKYFKAPDVCQALADHDLMTPISNLAETRIGIQTLAKEFFVFTPDKVQATKIEPEFLEPLAQSSRWFNNPIIEENEEPVFFTFHCSKSKGELQGTNALSYILQGETAKVPVRGKNIIVTGYHNKQRIREDGRNYWYDLRSALERRDRAEILIPRLVYRSFTVVWNKAKYVPGELFIEFLPQKQSGVDIEVYLAVLSSSVAEIMLRSSAQIYGAGTYNIAPGQIKRVPILNAEKLTAPQQEQLKGAYQRYLADENHDRAVIDKVIYEILGFDSEMQEALKEVINDMHQLATSAKESGLTHE